MSLETLKKFLVDCDDYVKLCDEAKIAMQSDSEALTACLMSEARLLLTTAGMSCPDAVALQRVALLLCLLVGRRETAEEQSKALSETLLPLLGDASDSLARGIIASELTYLDQYLKDTVRQSLLKTMRKTKLDSLTPSISDYLQAWDDQTNLEGLLDVVGPPTSKSRITVYCVCSAKGGVGKSVIALALLNALAQRRRQTRVAIVDLDPYAPTLQFTLDVPMVTNAHGLLPAPQSTAQWRYDTLFDTMWAADPSSPPEVEQAASRSIMSFRSHANASAVLLPDSPTYGAYAAAHWDSDVYRRKNLRALSATLDTLFARGHCDVVLDCRPGLFGVNGFMLLWLSRNYPTHLLIVSSPSSPDLATTLYEAIWMAASGLFRWPRPPQFLANMWPYQDDLLPTMDQWTTTFVNASIRRAVDKTYSISSACQIYAARMWAYLYWRTLKGSELLKAKALRYDDKLRDIYRPQASPTFAFPWEVLLASEWYKADLEPVLSDIPSEGSVEQTP